MERKFRTACILLILGLQCHAQPSFLNLGMLFIYPGGDIPPNNVEDYMNIVTTCSNNACTGRLWIYFSDASREQQWGTINMRGGMDQYERDIVCRQLGYKGSHDSSQREPPLSDDSAPIWLTNVTCGGVNERGNELNLLECNHFNICDSSCSHDDDVVMNCIGQKDGNFEDYYDGEVYLHPTTLKPHGMQTTFGIIEIQLENTAKSIALTKLSDVAMHFSAAKRDTLCKQMGFTGAVTDSVFTLSAAKSYFNFENYPQQSWFHVTDLKEYCNSNEYSPTPCFGCCFDYPKPGECSDCDVNNMLVMSCMYESINEHVDYKQKGYQDLCQLSGHKLPHTSTVCGNGNGKGKSHDSALIGALVPLVVILFVINVAFVVSYRKKCCSKNNEEYENM